MSAYFDSTYNRPQRKRNRRAYCAVVWHHNRRIWLGRYETLEKAREVARKEKLRYIAEEREYDSASS